MTHKELKIKYSNFYAKFEEMHKELGENGLANQGHGIDHDIMVACYCLLIAPDDNTAELSWVAALMHSTDRFYPEKTMEILDEVVKTTKPNLNDQEIQEAIDAVLKHSEPNKDSDSKVLIVLKDADRLANISPLVLMRAGQFRPYIPVIEFAYKGKNKNPNSTHQKPCSVKDNILSHMEWESSPHFGLRTEKAKELGKHYFDFLRQFLDLVEKQLDEIGI